MLCTNPGHTTHTGTASLLPSLARAQPAAPYSDALIPVLRAVRRATHLENSGRMRRCCASVATGKPCCVTRRSNSDTSKSKPLKAWKVGRWVGRRLGTSYLWLYQASSSSKDTGESRTPTLALFISLHTLKTPASCIPSPHPPLCFPLCLLPPCLPPLPAPSACPSPARDCMQLASVDLGPQVQGAIYISDTSAPLSFPSSPLILRSSDLPPAPPAFIHHSASLSSITLTCQRRPAARIC